MDGFLPAYRNKIPLLGNCTAASLISRPSLSYGLVTFLHVIVDLLYRIHAAKPVRAGRCQNTLTLYIQANKKRGRPLTTVLAESPPKHLAHRPPTWSRLVWLFSSDVFLSAMPRPWPKSQPLHSKTRTRLIVLRVFNQSNTGKQNCLWPKWPVARPPPDTRRRRLALGDRP